MLTIHHLGKSQSERIIWLCEELEIPYEIKRYERDPITMLAPPELRTLHPIGSAPVITDGDVVLAESAAIMEYIIAKHGGGRLAHGTDHPGFADYLYWFHFANGTLQPSMGRIMTLRRLSLPQDNPVLITMKGRLDRALDLAETRLGAVIYFAGSEFTAADIIMVFSLTTMRNFLPLDLAPYPNILAYLQRIGARDGYRRAMQKADPGLTPLLS
jgi:glutathione S-transferase